MKIDMYQATVPPCARALTNLSAILDKADAHAASRKIAPAVLLETRLFPDMLPLTMQIVIACDIARGGAARLAGAPVPALEIGRGTFAALNDGIKHSIAHLHTLTSAQFEGAEDRQVTWETRSTSKSMQGIDYLFNHVLPNVFFHVATAYGILRVSGLDLGKQDFLGKS